MPRLRFEQSLPRKIVPEERSCHVLPSRRDGALWRRELVEEDLVREVRFGSLQHGLREGCRYVAQFEPHIVRIHATTYSTVTENPAGKPWSFHAGDEPLVLIEARRRGACFLR